MVFRGVLGISVKGVVFVLELGKTKKRENNEIQRGRDFESKKHKRQRETQRETTNEAASPASLIRKDAENPPEIQQQERRTRQKKHI